MSLSQLPRYKKQLLVAFGMICCASGAIGFLTGGILLLIIYALIPVSSFIVAYKMARG